MPVSVTPGKPLQSGSVTVVILTLSTPITFASSMPDINYTVYFAPVGTLNTALAAISQTTTGFTMTLGIGVSGVINWIAVAN